MIYWICNQKLNQLINRKLKKYFVDLYSKKNLINTNINQHNDLDIDQCGARQHRGN